MIERIINTKAIRAVKEKIATLSKCNNGHNTF